MLAVVTDIKDGYGLKFEKKIANFSKFSSCVLKKLQKNCLLPFVILREHSAYELRC